MSEASTSPVEMRGLQGMADRERLNAEISTGLSTGTAQQQSDPLRASAPKTVPWRVKQKASQLTAHASRPVCLVASESSVRSAFTLSASEWRFAGMSFATKVVLFLLSELVICQLDPERWACSVVSKGFIPCLITFALMDLLVIPRIRRLRKR